jgi:PD-(D/E)XK nuclease superfamily
VLIPDPPTPQPIESISPTLYETILACPARAVWSVNGQRGALPPHPSALLGTCFHGVMEAAQKGLITGGDFDECRIGAAHLFDTVAAKAHSSAHPLLRVKFPTPAKLPFYNLYRERGALAAAELISRRRESAGPGHDAPAQAAEQRFRSVDGLIVGRPDLIDTAAEEVVDYKTGLNVKEPWQVSQRESRQLSLYAYLAREASISISRGKIVRGDGQSATIDITPAMADAEAEHAREVLAVYNASAAGADFSDVARPSPETCRSCPCIPMCGPFWQAAEQTWQDDSGVHLQGTVMQVQAVTVQNTPILTLEVEATGGTTISGSVVLEQIPTAWVTADGDRLPEVNDIVRLVDARMVSEDPAVVRVDRIMTSLWRLSSFELRG